MTAISQLADLISKTKGAKFASFVYTAKETGEVSKIRVILGASTETLYQKDIDILTAMIPTLEGLKLQAAMAILNSRKVSLSGGIGNNPAYTQQGLYVKPEGFHGVDVNVENGTVSITGLVEDKQVITKGVYKEVNSKPLTLAKKEIEKGLKSSRFRRYLLHNVSRAAMNGEVLEIECEPEVLV